MTGTQAAPPRAPRGLGSHGRRFWADMVSTYVFARHELELLKAAARTVDRLEVLALAEAQIGDELIVAGKTGPAVHPVIIEQRMTMQALGRVLASLRIPSDEADGAGRGAYRRPRMVEGAGA